ncbi:RlpA-like double-psi beta-barrel-protein domain-containing protein-containing protein, partial [Aspergillus karnatakaensis]|uniref:putative endoglucanase n=1 Tax=Aspergillus karnatakaensis TaxID=1810916 RepID=UPI003CCD4F12
HYSDGLQGACGCGTSTGTYTWQYGITHHIYTAAASQSLFDTGQMAHWCGSGCGKCYHLTSTGVSPCATCGTGGIAGKSITVMVTNLCPHIGNEAWCPNPGNRNPAGFEHHFDIMGGKGVFGDNVVVEFREVECPKPAGVRWGTCECHPNLRGQDLRGGLHTGGVGVVGPVEAAVISVNGAVAPRATDTSQTTQDGQDVPKVDGFVTVAKAEPTESVYES